MKFVFDFDGVFTCQRSEAERVKEIAIEILYKNSGLEKHQVDALIGRAACEVEKNPFQHGWKNQGRLTAYGNEDFFMYNTAIMNCLDDLAPKEGGDFLKALQNLKKNGFESFATTSDVGYAEMAEETKNSIQENPIDPYARELLEGLLAKGHDITFVSNSSTTRVEDIFKKTGIVLGQFKNGGTLGVRGSARKFNLTEAKQGFAVGQYWVETGRPVYEKIIREEKPDVVVGDVFTLDLAVPYHLTQTEPETFAHLKLVLREQQYTPDWSKNFFLELKQKSPDRFFVINDLHQFWDVI